jgi:hypothetical protein
VSISFRLLDILTGYCMKAGGQYNANMYIRMGMGIWQRGPINCCINYGFRWLWYGRYGDTGAPAIAASAPKALASNMLQLSLTCTADCAGNPTSVTKKLPSALLPT